MALQKRMGQSSIEYILLFALSLVILIVAFAFVLFWPNFLHSVEEQRALTAWGDSRPFSVIAYYLTPNRLVFEVWNTEPVSLTITEIRLSGVALDFYNHTYPYTEPGTSVCPSDCSLFIPAGQRAIISTEDFTTLPHNPCLDSTLNFIDGKRYEIAFDIYYQTDTGETLHQGENVLLVGKCARSAA